MPQAITVTVTPEERAQLEAIARSRSLPHGLVRRAQIILGSADGVSSMELAHRHQVSRPTIGRWRRRWCMIWMLQCVGLRRVRMRGRDASGGSLIGRRKRWPCDTG